MKAGYVKKSQAKKHNHTVTICIILAVVFFLCSIARNAQGLKHKDSVQNVETFEYIKTYTIEYYNGVVSAVYVDWNKYDIDTITGYNPDNNSESVDSCDEIATDNEEGHVCVLTDNIRMWRFLTYVGY